MTINSNVCCSIKCITNNFTKETKIITHIFKVGTWSQRVVKPLSTNTKQASGKDSTRSQLCCKLAGRCFPRNTRQHQTRPIHQPWKNSMTLLENAWEMSCQASAKIGAKLKTGQIQYYCLKMWISWITASKAFAETENNNKQMVMLPFSTNVSSINPELMSASFVHCGHSKQNHKQI